MYRSRMLLLAVAVVAAGLVAASPAAAASGFSCKASALQVLGMKSNVTAGATPCTSGFRYLASNVSGPLRNGLVTAGGLYALTVPTREAAGSRAAVGDVVVTLPGLVLRAEALTADAVVRCTGDGPRPETDGAIGRVTLNGAKLASGDSSLSLPLGLVAVHVNHVHQTATSIRRRALWVQTPLGDVVVAEASAGTFGSPCPVAVPR